MNSNKPDRVVIRNPNLSDADQQNPRAGSDECFVARMLCAVAAALIVYALVTLIAAPPTDSVSELMIREAMRMSLIGIGTALLLRSWRRAFPNEPLTSCIDPTE